MNKFTTGWFPPMTRKERNAYMVELYCPSCGNIFKASRAGMPCPSCTELVTYPASKLPNIKPREAS